METNKAKPSVAVIVLNYNSWQDTIECVSLLLQQNYQNLLIIIVDNGSSDDSLEKMTAWVERKKEIDSQSTSLQPLNEAADMVEYKCDILEKGCIPKEENKLQSYAFHRTIVLIRNWNNLGYSAGNNVGIRYALKKGADAILIANPDVRIGHTRTLRELVDILFSSDDIFVVGPNVIDAGRNRQSPLNEPSFFQECTYPLMNVFGRALSLRMDGYLSPIISDRPFQVEKVAGCCLMIRTSFLKEAGLLDEGVFLYCEESILADQVKKAKGRLFFVPGVVVRHLHKKSLTRHWQEFLKSRRYYLTKYRHYSSLQISVILAVHRIISLLITKQS